MSKKEKQTGFVRNTFFTGLFMILPIGITLWIISKIVTMGDTFLGNYIEILLGREIPGLGFIGAILIIFIVGLLVKGLIGRKIRSWIEILFSKIPFVRNIYKPINEIVESISNNNNENFKKVVLVKYPNENCRSIGFVTKEKIQCEGEEKSAIFVPTTPNPTSGFLLYINTYDIKELDMPVDIALKTIISLGSISPDILVEKE